MTAHIFDCDGVLLDSNKVKEEAFYRVAEPYGAKFARELVEYHRRAGATGRRDRVRHFFDQIMHVELSEAAVLDFEMRVTMLIEEGMRNCSVMGWVEDYLSALHSRGIELFCVSGIENTELHNILDHHGLRRWFVSCIGTNNKIAALTFLATKIDGKATYYGDTFDDAVAAYCAEMNFVLVTGGHPVGYDHITAITDFKLLAQREESRV